jgi:hypothetical protein
MEKDISHEPWGKNQQWRKITNEPHEKNIHESPRKLMQQKQ